jgi:hypothetical protein
LQARSEVYSVAVGFVVGLPAFVGYKDPVDLGIGFALVGLGTEIYLDTGLLLVVHPDISGLVDPADLEGGLEDILGLETHMVDLADTLAFGMDNLAEILVCIHPVVEEEVAIAYCKSVVEEVAIAYCKSVVEVMGLVFGKVEQGILVPVTDVLVRLSLKALEHFESMNLDDEREQAVPEIQSVYFFES